MKTRILFAAILVFAGYTMSQPSPTADPSPLPDRTTPPQLVARLRGVEVQSATAERYSAAFEGLAALIENDSTLTSCQQLSAVFKAQGTWVSRDGGIGPAGQRVLGEYVLEQFGKESGELTAERRSRAVAIYRDISRAFAEVAK